jgi:hypothetical protein
MTKNSQNGTNAFIYNYGGFPRFQVNATLYTQTCNTIEYMHTVYNKHYNSPIIR